MILIFLFPLILGLHAKELVDMRGVKVTLPEKIEKAFGMSPPATFLLYSLDPTLIAGINFDPKRGDKEALKMLSEEYKKLPVLGGLHSGGNSINKEEVLVVRPDIAVYMRKNAGGELVEKFMQDNGIAVFNLDTETIEGLPKAYALMGEIFSKHKERAMKLSHYAQQIIDKANSFAKNPSVQRKVVYYAQGSDGLKTGCDKSAHYSAIAFVGGTNPHVCKASNANNSLEQIPIEQVILYNPDIIIVQDKEFFEKIKNDPQWALIKAVKEDKFYLVPRLPLNWIDRPPSFMRLLGVSWLTHVIYNEPNKNELKSEMRGFYKLFLNIDLSDEQIEQIVGKL